MSLSDCSLLWSSCRISGWPSLSCCWFFSQCKSFPSIWLCFSLLACLQWGALGGLSVHMLRTFLYRAFYFCFYWESQGFNGPELGFVLLLLVSQFAVYHIGHANVTLVSTSVTGLRFFFFVSKDLSLLPGTPAGDKLSHYWPRLGRTCPSVVLFCRRLSSKFCAIGR